MVSMGGWTLVTLAVAAGAWAWRMRSDAAAVRLCGRKLSEIMSRVCYVYNSPSWDNQNAVVRRQERRRRSAGIADECCTFGCTWEQLSDYCAVSASSESPLETLVAHLIEDRSAENDEPVSTSPATPASTQRTHRRRRRCRCRHNRRSTLPRLTSKCKKGRCIKRARDKRRQTSGNLAKLKHFRQ